MRKYGIDNFSIDVVEHVDDMRSLGERERHYIKLYDTQNPKNGYNLSAGGEHNQYDGNPKSQSYFIRSYSNLEKSMLWVNFDVKSVGNY